VSAAPGGQASSLVKSQALAINPKSATSMNPTKTSLAALLAGLALSQAQAQAADSYDIARNQLTIPAVLVEETLYSNVVITVGNVVHIGGGAPQTAYDTYFPQVNQISIPSVVAGGVTYTNVIASVGTVLKVGGSQAAYANAAVSKICPAAQGFGTYGNCKGTGDATTVNFFQPLTAFFGAITGKISAAGTRSDLAVGADCKLFVEPFIPLFSATVNGKPDAGAAFKGLADDTIGVDPSGNPEQITVGQRGVTTALEINAFDGHIEAVLFNAKGDYAICTFR
jgi:hypothetical protein